jgi:hypothetical protein
MAMPYQQDESYRCFTTLRTGAWSAPLALQPSPHPSGAKGHLHPHLCFSDVAQFAAKFSFLYWKFVGSTKGEKNWVSWVSASLLHLENGLNLDLAARHQLAYTGRVHFQCWRQMM